MLEGMRTFRSVGENLTYDYFCCVLAMHISRQGARKKGAEPFALSNFRN